MFFCLVSRDMMYCAVEARSNYFLFRMMKVLGIMGMATTGNKIR